MSDDKRAEDGQAIQGPAWAAAQVALTQGGARADAFLDEQARLARVQREQIEEENATRRHLLRIEHVSALLKLALELSLAAVAAVIVIGLGAAIWSAANDSGLVVESFSVPPDLASRGITGDVVATRLLDRLSSLQQQTQSSRAASSYANNWGSDIKLQIPDTGVSIGEFNRSLHAWLGHQTRITGEIYRTPAGIAVTARAGSDASPTFTGSDADLDKLMQQAAESVYRATQPYRYAVYLANVGRNKEAETAYQQLIAGGAMLDRAWALIGLENIYANRADYPRALAALDRARAILPGFVMSDINRAGIEGQFQHDEASLAFERKSVARLRGQRPSDMSEIAWEIGRLQSEAALDGDLGDYSGQIEIDRRVQALPDFSGAVDTARQNDVGAYAFLHDAASTDAAFQAMAPASNNVTNLQRNATRALSLIFLDRPEFLLAHSAEFDAALAKLGPIGHVIASRQFWPFAAYALALKGDFKGAHAMVDRTPIDCNQCLRARGVIDMLERNWGGAEYWFARAARDAPSLPQAWSDWGRMLLGKGDLERACTMFATAHARGPRYADPLEMWGEALLRLHRADEALPKFAEAARYAPNWKRMHLKWGEALEYLGRKDDAAKQFALARSLDG
jgi:tetratricopeptide (TPR) repeat protein